MDSYSRAMPMFVLATNIYNYCNIEYLLMAFSKSVSSVSGACNQVVNLVWRIIEDTDTLNGIQ